MTSQDQNSALLGLTAEIVSAHIRKNQVPPADLPRLIEQVYAALRNAGAPIPAPVPAEKPAPEPRLAPAVPVKKSIFPDYLVCLEDGRKFKTLKRHLRSTYGMTPEQYREKWDLPPDYPMVAPNYAVRRSTLAKQLGLGLGRKGGETSGKPAAARAEAPVPEMDDEVPEREAAAPPALAESVPSAAPVHTAESVFARFPRGTDADVEEEDAPRPATPDPRRRTRKPFSKQLARSMRP